MWGLAGLCAPCKPPCAHMWPLECAKCLARPRPRAVERVASRAPQGRASLPGTARARAEHRQLHSGAKSHIFGITLRCRLARRIRWVLALGTHQDPYLIYIYTCWDSKMIYLFIYDAFLKPRRARLAILFLSPWRSRATGLDYYNSAPGAIREPEVFI